MENVLFLQSEMADPYTLYQHMQNTSPVYFGGRNNIWAIYSYEGCASVLQSSRALIPEADGICNFLSIDAKEVVDNLARLINAPAHAPARRAATDLMSRWQQADVPALVQYLLREPRLPAAFDWVEDIGKKLPALALLKGFGLPAADISSILPKVSSLTLLMNPARTEKEGAIASEAVSSVYHPLHKYLADKLGITKQADMKLYFSNFIGLLIQSYDAGWGLLSNAFLQSVKRAAPGSFENARRLVLETLRFDSPVHNTRRTMAEPLVVGGHQLRAGDQVLLVVAAANRDPRVFSEPATFDTSRADAGRYLSYGKGPHQCVAEHFAVHITAAALHHMHSKYQSIELLEEQIRYEPRVNVRLPVRIQFRVA